MATYSFIDVAASITGIGGTINLGYGAGNAEEGISITMVEAKNTMMIGADGTAMHSLHAGQGASITVTLLKTSPINKLLADMLNSQRVSSVGWGKNVITIRNIATGDVSTATQVAFQKWPDITYAKDGGTNSWVFDVGVYNGMLGEGNQ